jgi:hypothetical protein
MSTEAPSCHACAAPATTKCQRCGTLACVAHIDPIRVHMRSYELRCKKCYERADADNAGYRLLLVMFFVIFGAFAMVATTCSPTGR